MTNLLQQYFLENSLKNWLSALGIIFFGLVLGKGLSNLVGKQLFRVIKKEVKTAPLADFARLLHKPIQYLFVLVSFYLAAQQLFVPKRFGWVSAHKFGFLMLVERSYASIFLLTIGFVIMRLVKFLAIIWQQEAEKTLSKLDDQLVPFIRDLIIVLNWLVIVFVIMGKVFDVDVAALVTSLGIGGLAIALAAKETLENFFASFTIFLDKPFVVGDTVKVNETFGDVEKLGFRSTRIRTPDGSLVTIPNRLVTSHNLENLSQRQFRRHKFYVRLTLQTPQEIILKIINDLEQYIDKQPLTSRKKGLVRFEHLAESSLNILVIFHVESIVWEEYQAMVEAVNFKTLEIIIANGGQLAYPTLQLKN